MVSLSTSATITIAREPDAVWAYVADLTNQDHWVDGMSDSKLVGDGPIGVGAQVRGTYSYGGRSDTTLLTITEFREGRRLGFEASEGPFPFRGLLTIERAAGGASAVTNTMTAGSDHLFTSIMFTLLRPLMKRLMARQLQKELGQLKALLERG